MKSASFWANQFLNQHVVNVRSGEFTQFVADVQRDAQGDPRPAIMHNLSDRAALVMALHEEQSHDYPGKDCVIAAIETALRVMDKDEYFKTHIELSQKGDV